MPEADSREDTDSTGTLDHPELETEGNAELTPATDHPAYTVGVWYYRWLISKQIETFFSHFVFPTSLSG